jgi:Lon protease-like protein
MDELVPHSVNVPIPAVLPVMVLPECHLFPNCLLPLFIYEERYRQMLSHALGADRMFCVGNREGVNPDGSDRISEHSTAGLVRCCVKQPDGTSQLLLLGLQRVRFKKWVQEKPYRMAEIEPVPTIIEDPAAVSQLRARALEMFHLGGEENARQLRKALEVHECPTLVCDVLSYHFTRCPKLQQKLLAESDLIRRYEMLIAALEKTRGSN